MSEAPVSLVIYFYDNHQIIIILYTKERIFCLFVLPSIVRKTDQAKIREKLENRNGQENCN